MKSCLDRARGTTLPETLVALALFGLVLALVADLAVASQRLHARGTDRAGLHRAAAVAADRMGRELRLCRKLYAPSLPEGGGAARWGPTGGRLLVVFRCAGPEPGGDRVVGFRFEEARGRVERLLYQPDFDPARPGSQVLLGAPRALATGLGGMAFWLPDPASRSGAPFAGLELAVPGNAAGPGARIPSEVRVKGL